MKGSRSSLISRFALSTSLMAAAVILLAAMFFHFLRGDLFMGSFEAPLDDWASGMAQLIVADPEIASNVARNHKLGIIIHGDEGEVAFAPGGEAIDPELLVQHAAGFRQIHVSVHGKWAFTFYLDREQFSEPRLA